MHIAIDALGISQPGGGRSATLSLLEAIFALDEEHHYVVFVDQPEPLLKQWPVRVEQRVLGIKNRFLVRLAAQALFPWLLRRDSVDLVHFVKNLSVVGVPGVSVVTVYDLTILHYPQVYPHSDVLYWRWIEPWILRQADRVIAISHETAQDLVRFYKLDPGRVHVIYPGIRPLFRPIDAQTIDRVWNKYRLPRPAILHIGSISRKKNLLPVVQAIHALRNEGAGIRLVLVGREYGKGRDMALYSYIEKHQLKDVVCFTGPVSDEDLPALYSGARLLAFPSLHEGFGLVPVEAMACGLPVVTSGGGAVAEVVGDAALVLHEPRSSEMWIEAIRCLLQDEEKWQELRTRGLDRARLFDPRRAARETLELYQEAARLYDSGR